MDWKALDFFQCIFDHNILYSLKDDYQLISILLDLLSDAYSFQNFSLPKELYLGIQQ